MHLLCKKKGNDSDMSNQLSYGNFETTYDIQNEINDLRYKKKEVREFLVSFLADYGNSTFMLDKNLDPWLMSLIHEICEFSNWIECNTQNPLLAAHLMDYFFNSFTPITYALSWTNSSSKIEFLWAKLLEGVFEWEEEKSKSVHKGTPYFFLGGELLIQGNFDLAFIYIHNAIEEDMKISEKSNGSSNYKNAPAYLTASLIDDKKNYLFQLVDTMRKEIGEYLVLFNQESNEKLTLQDISLKFLQNDRFEEEKFWFIRTFFKAIQMRDTIEKLIDNDYSRLQNLNIIFSLCLVTDAILEERYQEGKFYNNIIKLLQEKNWMAKSEFDDLTKYINAEKPDTIIPELCSPPDILWGGRPLPENIKSMIIARQLRNYGGHNLEKQYVTTFRFEDILKELMFSFFVAIMTIN